MKKLITLLTILMCATMSGQTPQYIDAGNTEVVGVVEDSISNPVDFLVLDAENKFRKVSKDSLTTSVSWSEITGDQSDIDLSGFTNDLGLATVATTGDYGDLSNTPTIPTVLNDLSDVDVDGGQANNDVLAWSSGDNYFTPVPHIGVGGSAHPLATGSTAGFISGENQTYINQMKEVTAKLGTNFQTIKYFAETGTYQASGVTSILPGFYVGSNVFSVGDRDNNAIYEGTLWYRYTPTAGSTTDLEFTFAGNTHLIKNHTNEGAPTFHKYEFVIRFETSPAQYTIYVYDSDSTPFTIIEDESYTNLGNQTFDITIDKSDATSEVRVFRADLKRIN